MSRTKLFSNLPNLGNVPILGKGSIPTAEELNQNHPLEPTINRTVVAVGDWIVCKPVREHRIAQNGLVVENTEGIVQSVGDAVKRAKVGDRILWSGRLIKFTSDGEEYYACRDSIPGPGDLAINTNGEPIGPPFLMSVLTPVQSEDKLQ